MSPLLYILHSGQLFGTERMAVHTAAGLADAFDGIILAPPGPVHAYAASHGLRTLAFASRLDLLRQLWRASRGAPDLAVAATGLAHSLAMIALRALRGARMRHLHVVHGGTDERLSYGRKHLLNAFDVRFVAVSDFVRQRLVAHGVRPESIQVIENFMPDRPDAVRPPYARDGVRRVVMLSRLDRIKRVDLLMTALRRHPDLAGMRFDLYGSGEEAERLRANALALPNVHLHGFQADAAARLSQADLLLHTCPEEPFGLVVLEAYAAGVPVLVPNAGGAGALVRNGETGFHFAANDPVALGRKLRELQAAPAELLNRVARHARAELDQRFSPGRQIGRYAHILGCQE